LGALASDATFFTYGIAFARGLSRSEIQASHGAVSQLRTFSTRPAMNCLTEIIVGAATRPLLATLRPKGRIPLRKAECLIGRIQCHLDTPLVERPRIKFVLTHARGVHRVRIGNAPSVALVFGSDDDQAERCRRLAGSCRRTCTGHSEPCTAGSAPRRRSRSASSTTLLQCKPTLRRYTTSTHTCRK